VSAGRPPQRTRFHPERLLPFACIVAAVALFASELTTTFHFVPPGGEALCAQQASDRHHFALGVIALFAIGAVVVAILGASRPAAISVQPPACGRVGPSGNRLSNQVRTAGWKISVTRPL